MTLDAIDMFLKIEGGDFSFIRMLSVILESIHTYFYIIFIWAQFQIWNCNHFSGAIENSCHVEGNHFPRKLN